MRFLLLLGLGLLACGGGTTTDPAPSGVIAVTHGGSAGRAGLTAGDGTGDVTAGEAQGGGAVSPPAGAAGEATASTGGYQQATGGTGNGGTPEGGVVGFSGSGGTSGAAAGDAGAGGESGDPPAPDDTGCIDRPWSGNLGNLSEQLPGIDCSSCSTGAAMGYAAPEFCAGVTSCMAAVDVTTLPHDVFLLLPPGAAQAGCREQNCANANGDPADLPGFRLQLLLNIPTGHTVKIETDGARRVLKRDLPLIKCTEASSCYAFGSQAQFAIVVTPYAPRGWVRIKVDTGDTCK